MSTTSTIPTVKARLVTILTAPLTLLDAPVFYAWPGPSTPHRCVFLGRHPELDDIRINGESTIPTIKAGRKQRQETYTVPITVWTFRPDLDPAAAAECEADGFALAAIVEDILADDPKIGLGPNVHRVSIDDVASTLWPFQAGWACEVALTVEVSARLT